MAFVLLQQMTPQVTHQRIHIGVTIAQGFDSLDAITDGGMIATAVIAPNGLGAPVANMLRQVHGNLAIKASRL
jgi:hypothetical protein